MLNRIREQIGTAGLIVAVVALVAALGGGAVAATSSGGGNGKATASKKAKAKQGKPGKPGKNGKDGAPGPAGPAGPAGAKGDTGAAGTNGTDGTNGTNGTNGKTVLNGVVPPTGSVGTDGDFYIDTTASMIYGPKASGTWPAGVDLKGDEGSPWTAGGTLPPGETLTGAWSVTGIAASSTGIAALSFPIALAASLPESKTKVVPVGGPAPSGCTGGTAANPKADLGFLCVYAGGFTNANYASVVFGSVVKDIIKVSAAGNGADTSGARLLIAATAAGGSGFGTFAVSGPTPAP